MYKILNTMLLESKLTKRRLIEGRIVDRIVDMSHHISRVEKISMPGPLKIYARSWVEKHLPVGVFQNENLL